MKKTQFTSMWAPFHAIVEERLFLATGTALQRGFSTPGAIIRMLALDDSRLMEGEVSQISTESASDAIPLPCEG
jgi:hypothetical protein